MKTQIYEGQRIQLADAVSSIITFKERHDTIPFLTLTLEYSSGEGDNTNTFITDVNVNTATVNFSTAFSGYLHVHAFSKLVA